MKKTISIIRIATLLAICAAALVFIFCEDQDEDFAACLLHFCLNKTFGVIAFILVCLLSSRWDKSDPWIKAYDQMCDDTTDNPNPLSL